jgi:hypothetical protein
MIGEDFEFSIPVKPIRLQYDSKVINYREIAFFSFDHLQ